MITNINNKKEDIAKEIRNIFQAAYTIEAELLDVIDFPPLARTISQFLISENKFYAYYLTHDIAGVIEIDNKIDFIHIQSLVVYPRYFRKGIARKLIQFILDTYESTIFTVETGIENHPAIRLYESFDFKEQYQWDTDHGVRKVRYEKRV